MATKDDARYEFFRALRTSLNMLSLYSKVSPFFAKSIEELKKTIDLFHSFSNPIKFGITNNALLIDGKALEKSGLHEELARIFHSRKVKSIEIAKGITNAELIHFLSAAHLSAKQVLKEGGIGNILKKSNVTHIVAEDLDYSQLLQDAGEECQDIWSFLLGEAVDKKDTRKINEFADNVGKIMGNFKARDFAENAELRNNVYRFLDYLKDHQNDKFRKGSQEMLKLIIRDKDITYKDKIAGLETFLQGMSGEDFAQTLSEQIINDENFDSLSLNVFSMLVDEKKHKEIASSFGEKLASQQSWKNSPKVKKKIENLVSSPDTSSISSMYRNVLFSLMKEISFTGSFNFDRDSLRANYRFMLLNLLSQENDQKRLTALLEIIVAEWEELTKDQDVEYLTSLLKIAQKRKTQNPQLTPLFEGLDSRIANFVENSIFNEGLPGGMESFLDVLERSSLGINTYLTKIFNENKVNPWLFKLFFKFFPQNLSSLYERIEAKYNDLEFLSRMIVALKGVDTAQALEVLKHTFEFSNVLMKIEVLKAMREMTQTDREFLLLILDKGDINLKKNAMAILINESQAEKKAFDKLFLIPNPFGKNNNTLIENIIIVDELDVRSASEYLRNLSQTSLFWKRSVKIKALEVLRKWNVRKD